jgi:hypothetical protein
MNSDVDTRVVSPASGIKTISDFYVKQAVAASTRGGAQSYSFPIAYQKTLGMKFKVISGYRGTPDRIMAMERGEVNSACGITVSTFRSQVAGFARAGKVFLVAPQDTVRGPERVLLRDDHDDGGGSFRIRIRGNPRSSRISLRV